MKDRSPLRRRTVRRIIRIASTIGTVFFVIIAAILRSSFDAVISSNVQQFLTLRHQDEFVSRYWEPIMSELQMLAQGHWSWFIFVGGFLTGSATVSWFVELFPRRATDETVPISKHRMPTYVETKLRLRQSQGNKLYYEEDEANTKNIFNWKQLIARVEGDNRQAMLHNDSFFLVFNHPIRYGWPKVNSFGHPFPIYNFWALTERSALLQVAGEIEAPMFEIDFPPDPNLLPATFQVPLPLNEETKTRSIRGQGAVGPAQRPA